MTDYKCPCCNTSVNEPDALDKKRRRVLMTCLLAIWITVMVCGVVIGLEWGASL